MPIIKHRGKTSILNTTLNSANTTSPLRIESVLPTVNRSSSKSIYRSYSTLSSGYFKKPTTTTNASDSERLQNAQSSPSGFWHIQRTAKEKEKLPDRINLDRRGLTALPVIDDEPQLRLLSLQHNLINSFSVPEVVDKVKALPTKPEDTRQSSPASESSTKPVKGLVSSKKANLLKSNNRVNTLRSQNKNLLNTNAKSPTSATHQTYHHNPLHPNPIIKNSFIQKSVLLHAKEKYVFRKSSSFINSYSRHLAASKIHLGYLMESNVKSNSNISFSTDSSVSDLDSKSTVKPNDKPTSPTTSKAHVQSTTPPKNTTNTPAVLNNVQCRNDLQNLMIHNENIPVNNLQNLVFIDLYDNQIEKISSLDGLKSLTVLLLGKNRISDISGLISVRHTLRVLDLHGNKITGISQKICQLQELKSLNLAGNNLKTVYADDFKGLFNLRELNLKRNHIKRINGFEDLRHLERLWLCHNDLQKIEDMSCIAKAVNLKEVTLENNPVSLGGDCVSFLVSYLPCIVLLSQMQVTEQVRRAAMAWRLSKETSDANYSHLSNDVSQNQRREEIISNARTNWELLRSQQRNHVARNSAAQPPNQVDGKNKPIMPMSDIDPDTFSEVSGSVRCSDRKSAIVVARQKTISNRVRSLKKTFQGRNQKRSMSHENAVQDEEDVDKVPDSEYFRLPPILATFLVDGVNEKVSTSSTSGSSLSPNIDSSSSYLSSDNDNNKDDEYVQVEAANADNDANAGVSGNTDNTEIVHEIMPEIQLNPPKSCTNEDTVQTNKQPQTRIQDTSKYPNEPQKDPPSIAVDTEDLSVIPQTKPDALHATNTDDTNSDKVSDISFNSNKSAISELVFDESAKSSKCRSAFSSRRYVSPLARAQTARSTNPNAQHCNQSNKPALKAPAIPVTNERDREQGGDYLIEICGRYLNVYGAGAIKFIDRQWNVQKAADVHTFKFSYIHFNSIASILGKVKIRFPNAENFIFRETNINCLGQLNALAEIQGIHSLTIDPEGNLVCTKPGWRLYAIYRLSHWDVKIVNGEDVTEKEVAEAQHMYSGLSKLVLWSLPDALLEPLLARLHLDESCAASRMSPKQWLMQADESLRNVVGKEALQWKKSMGGTTITGSALSGTTASTAPDEGLLRQQGKDYFKRLMENTCNSTEKLNKLETLWPIMLVEMIRNTLLDYAQLDVYVRNLMIEMVATIPKTSGTAVAGASWRIQNNQ